MYRVGDKVVFKYKEQWVGGTVVSFQPDSYGYFYTVCSQDSKRYWVGETELTRLQEENTEPKVETLGVSCSIALNNIDGTKAAIPPLFVQLCKDVQLDALLKLLDNPLVHSIELQKE